MTLSREGILSTLRVYVEGALTGQGDELGLVADPARLLSRLEVSDVLAVSRRLRF